jgi:hypothetical protein
MEKCSCNCAYGWFFEIHYTSNYSRAAVTSYHYTRVQQVQEEDYPRRIEFCRWLLQENELNPNFARNILFTAECSFSKKGMYSAHNWHFWAHENPNIITVRGFQEKFL